MTTTSHMREIGCQGHIVDRQQRYPASVIGIILPNSDHYFDIAYNPFLCFIVAKGKRVNILRIYRACMTI